MLDHKYKVFYHLAQTPNTTKVAEELLLSQPAISKNIKELEKELGITLFNRIKGRMQLTEAGQYLYSEIEILVRKEREINFRIDKMKHTFTGTLHIGASTTLSQYVLPETLVRFKNASPQMAISLMSGNTAQIEQEIVTGNLHVAFIEGTPTQPDLHYISFLRDEIVLVTGAETKIPEHISPEQFPQLPFVLREQGSGTYHVIRNQLAQAGIAINTLNCQLVLGSTEGIKHYLLHSNCFALLSIYSIREEVAAGKLKIIDIDELNINRMFYIIHWQGEPDPYAKQFIEFSLRQKF